MKKKMVAMLLGLALAASTLGGCGEATVSEDTTEVVEEIEETEEAEAEAEVEIEEESEEASEETEESEEAEKVTGEETTEAEVETETEAEVETTTETEVVYTYSEVTATMYAKQSVNVRDLPSTSGNRVGGLSTNQEVSVTGQCNETGWYRISYNGADAYVSNNYLVSEKVVTQTTSTQDTSTTTTQDTSTTTTQTETQQTTETTSTATQVSDSTSTTTQNTTSYTLPQYFNSYAEAYDAAVYWQTVMNVKVIIDTTRTDGLYAVLDYNTVMGASTTASEGADEAATTTTVSDTSGYSTECVGYINDLRASLGLSSLTWSDSLAEVALARAQEQADLGTLDGHAGLSKYGSYGENCHWGSSSASGAYNAWYNSEGHYNNMVNSNYTYVAVAYVGNYWVTIFQ